MSDFEYRLSQIRKKLLIDAALLIVDHTEMIDQLSVELMNTFDRDFGLRQIVPLLKASIEDMKQFSGNMIG